jgi:hypothetical protein
VSNVGLEPTSTTVTVTGKEVGCDDVEQGGGATITVRIRLWDGDGNLVASKIRSVDIGHKWSPAVFSGLDPATTYRVTIEDNSRSEDFSRVFDDSVTTLGG